MRKQYLLIGSIFFVLLTGCKKELNSNADTANLTGEEQRGNTVALKIAGKNHVPNEILVKFKKGTSETGRAKALTRIGGRVQEHILTNAMQHFGDDEGIFLIHTSINALEAIAKAKGEEVVYAELNWIYTHPEPTPDPYYIGTGGNQLWGMGSSIQNGSNADAAWQAHYLGSKTVYVGVIDEGIQLTHPDLKDNIWTNPYDPIDKKDNDKNGYIDDVNGWDFDGNNNTIYDGGTTGSNDDHGTHVAGTIGAKGGNGIGVAGVNWNVTLISAKYLGRRGGTTANAIKAVDYFTDLKIRHNLNIVATNNSWGGGGFSQALLDAITRGAKKNILFIAAAGNGGGDGVGDNNDAVASYPSNYNTEGQLGGSSTYTSAGGSNINDAVPCSYDAVIAVAAIKPNGYLRTSSNYGATKVDIAAPGEAIASTTAFNLYEYYSGTSMATPHVTGAAALYKSKYIDATAAEIKYWILKSAIETSSLIEKCATGGRLDIFSALQNTANPNRYNGTTTTP